MQKLIIIFIFLLAGSSALKAQTSGFTISVNLKNVTEQSGTIYATLTTDEANFPAVTSSVAKQKMEVTPDTKMEFQFTGIPMGKYAIVVFHDLNNNGILDRNGQMPSEPFGFSMITYLMGPPTFEESAFSVEENKTLTISMMSF